jgi:IS5 family transposase
MQIEGLSFRETTIRIAESETLQNFCRLFTKSTIDHTLLCRAFQAIQASTWEKLNRILGITMKTEGKINPAKIRSDTTVTESNIHYPTDSNLLWDVYRTISRLVEHARDQDEVLPTIRIHLKKIKKLHLDITRFSKSRNKKRQRWVRKQRRKLIERVGKMVEKTESVVSELRLSEDLLVQNIATRLENYIPVMRQIVDVANRNERGEKVPVTDKVFSLFEPHTELIMRGRSGKT